MFNLPLPRVPSELLQPWHEPNEHGFVEQSFCTPVTLMPSCFTSVNTSSIVLHKIQALEEHGSLLCLCWYEETEQSLKDDISISSVEKCVSSIDDVSDRVVVKVQLRLSNGSSAGGAGCDDCKSGSS